MKSIGLVLAVWTSGCAATTARHLYVTENRMLAAAPRPAGCGLQLVQASIVDLSPLSTKWDLLGMLVVQQADRLDPLGEEVRAELRPRACAMGGEALSLMLGAATQGMFNSQAGGVVFAVLRKKSTVPWVPQPF